MSKTDAPNENSALWKIDSEHYFQKYESFIQEETMFYKSTRTFCSGLMKYKKDYYVLPFEEVEQTTSDHVVEVDRNSHLLSVSEPSTSFNQIMCSTSNESIVEKITNLTDKAIIRNNILGSLGKIVRNNILPVSTEDVQPQFFVEDTMFLTDIEVEVNGIGFLSFPLSTECIKKLIEKSSKAYFRFCDAIVLETQIIPASELNVTIKPQALIILLDELKKGFNLAEGSSLELHIRNLLIYGPGQTFKNTEKYKDVVGTLTIVLPSAHKEEELVTEDPECETFYSDRNREIKEVSEGCCVVLSYNIIPHLSKKSDSTLVDPDLDEAVENYFANGGKKFVYQMNHSYSEHSLKLSLLKSEDRMCANALFSVAMKQDRFPCLALAPCRETFERERSKCKTDSETSPALLSTTSTELYFWVDKSGANFQNPDNYCVTDDEIFFMEKTSKLIEAYEKSETEIMGNRGTTGDCRYRTAYVVLFPNRWLFSHSFRHALSELHQIAKEVGKESALKERLDLVGKDFFQPKIWKIPDIARMLVDIVIYMNSPYYASLILRELNEFLLNEKEIYLIIILERQFDHATWRSILDSWEKVKYFSGHNHTTKGLSFISKYREAGGDISKSQLIAGILNLSVEEFITGSKETMRYVYDRTPEETIEQLCTLFKLCADLPLLDQQASLMDHVITSYAVYPAVSKAQLYVKLHSILQPTQMTCYTDLLQSALHDIEAYLTRLGDTTNWSIPVPKSCGCPLYCKSVIEFFESHLSTEIVLSQLHGYHIRKYYQAHADSPFSISFTEDGKTIIKKEPVYGVIQDNLKWDLRSFQRLLQKFAQ